MFLLKGHMGEIQKRQLPSLGNSNKVSTIPCSYGMVGKLYREPKDLCLGGRIYDPALANPTESAICGMKTSQAEFVWDVEWSWRSLVEPP